MTSHDLPRPPAVPSAGGRTLAPVEDDDILDTAEGPQSRPQSLMLTFFGNHVLEEGDLGVYSGSIIDVLGRVGVGEQAVRSTLTRMVNRGLLQRQREGRKMFFGLTPQATRVLIDGRTRIWKQGAVNDDWDGSWTLLGFSLPDSWKRQRHDLRSRLTWSGFGALYSGLWIAPGHVDVSAVVTELGLTAHVKIFHAQASEVTDIERMIRETWDLESIAAHYVTFDKRWSANLGNGADDDPIGTLSARFAARSGVRSARLYATALGVYEAYVNGVRAGTAELSPGSTSYDRTLYAQASDVTSALKAGDNRLEFLLSDGWYRGQVGAFRLPAGWGTVPGARAELHLLYEDGARQVVRTDGTWTSAESAITRADLMDGQTTDFRVRPGTGLPVLVDQVEAPPVDWSPAPPVRVVESRPAQSVEQLEDGVWIADFGQNASGWIALGDLGPAGTRTIVDHGEHLGPDGDLTTAHLDSTRPGQAPIPFVQRDVAVSAGGGETFEPRHTVHGFRYARLRRDGAPLDPASLVMRVVHSDLRRTGTFVCGHHGLDRLHEIAEWSFRGNAVDVPTDCPTRERLAWTGDFQVFAPTATRLYDVLGFSRKWLRSVRDDQLPDGRVANFSPDGRRIKHHLDDQFAMMTGSAGWGDAVVAVPWELYESYGDREILAENWEAMVRWVEWALTTARTARHPSRVERSAAPLPHEQYLWDGSFHWGEWTEPKARAADGTRVDPVKDDPVAWFMADKGEVGTGFLYRSTATVARVARVLGLGEESDRYAVIAERVRDAWRTEFLSPDGRTAGDTQAGYVRALSLGLVPEELREAAAARLVELIDRKSVV